MPPTGPGDEHHEVPVPHDVKAQTIPGTEGWERMYPYQYRFVTDDPVRNQYEKETFWFYDGLLPRAAAIRSTRSGTRPGSSRCRQFNNRIFMVPPVRRRRPPDDQRLRLHISPVPVKDGNEIGSQHPHFMERAGRYYKNWDALEAKWKVKMEATIRELEALRILHTGHGEHEGRHRGDGRVRGFHLLKNYDDLINLGIKCWQYHFGS